MKSFEIIGWAYDAALHCDGCAHARFGAQLDDETNPPEDSEGNKVGPVFAGDELSPDGERCDDCGEEISEPWDDEDEDEENPNATL